MILLLSFVFVFSSPPLFPCQDSAPLGLHGRNSPPPLVSLVSLRSYVEEAEAALVRLVMHVKYASFCGCVVVLSIPTARFEGFEVPAMDAHG